MADTSGLYNDKRAYEILKSNMKSIVKNLDDAIDNLKIPVMNISKSYLINSTSADNGKLNSIREQLKNLKYNINVIVMNSINSKIGNINQDIENAREEE